MISGLPVELIERTLFLCWTMPLSMADRIRLMTSAPLVNSSWGWIFLRVSSRDVYVPCPSFAHHFLQILRPQSLPNVLCRSLTPKFDAAAGSRRVAELLHRFHDISAPAVPNLRRIHIEYRDMGFDCVFDNWTLVAFPPQVTELELSYSFSPAMPPWLRSTLRSKHKRQTDRPPWITPSVRTLTILGGSESLVLDMVMTCPNAQLVTYRCSPHSVV
ncbi:hypothetical protein DFH08DRAFT_707585 [Mycena albidolilacea]|uniref:Uncharacterized protein n=1 Tax=Mycena albidolilacea TaxID=1033008 RepID=A0AAD6ZPZ8_9AGAR|nr:hypothetical protein DFH08DRAFT_707585 [Mycena albidolilacea]